MYIAHYKSVSSSVKEFYSSKRKELDFPSQVEFKGERYSLFATHIVSTRRQEEKITTRAKALDIPTSVTLK